MPTIKIQGAFGNNVTDAAYTWTTVHDESLGAKVASRDLTYKRGRKNELNKVETGGGTILLKDASSDLDQRNPASKFYPNVRAYLPLRGQATIGGTTYDLFQHFLERFPRTKRVRSVYTERSLTTVDGFEWLARAGLSGASYSSELTGTRVGNVLNSVSWPAVLRTLGAGSDTIAAATFPADDATKALAHLLDVADWENGLLFIDASGRVAFVPRLSLITSPYTVSQATFCDVDAGGGFPFVESVPTMDLDTTFNEWSGTRTGGVTQVASDTTSRNRYGERAMQVTSEVTTDGVVLSQMQWKLSQFKEPLDRIESITVMPGTNTSFWQTVLGLEIGERVTVREKPPGFASVISTDYLIQNLDVHFPPGPASAAKFTFGLWPADTSAWFTLDDTSGKLDTGKVAY
jgi:hypothetical protein